MESYNKELCEERHMRIEERLCKHGEQIDSLEKCVIKLTEMVERFDRESLENTKRLDNVESRPLTTFGKVCGYTGSAFLGALSTWLIQYFELLS